MSAMMGDGEIAERDCPRCKRKTKSMFCPKCGHCEWCHENVDGILICKKD